MANENTIEIDFSKLKNIFKKLSYEHAFLLIFLIILLFFASTLGNGYLNHSSPYMFVAGDMFWVAQMADSVSETGGVNYIAPYLMDGVKNAVFNRPPLLFLQIAQISDFTGSKNYDIMFHSTLFLNILSIICLYFFLRLINKELAMFSIPLTLFIFRFPFNINMTWGVQQSVFNMFFVATSLILFHFLDRKNIFIPLGAVFAAGLLAHGKETIYSFGIFFAYFTYLFVKKNFNHAQFKNFLKSIGAMVLFSLLYLPAIVGFGNAKILWKNIVFAGIDAGKIVNFGFFTYVIIIGILLAFLYSLQKSKNQNTLSLALIFGFILLIGSFTNYVIGNMDAKQIRSFYPLFLCVFSGFAVFQLNSFLGKIMKNRKIVLFFLIIILFAGVLFYFPQRPPEYAVSNPLTWDSLLWVSKNVPENDTVLYLYGDNFYQVTLFLFGKRKAGYVNQQEIINDVQNKIIKNTFNITNLVTDLTYFIKKNFFIYDPVNHKNFSGYNICNFDYIYFNKISQYQILTSYVTEVKDILIKDLNYSVVYENDLVDILKNNNPGGKCFEKRTFSAK
jgi:hypothetical protein